MFSRTISRQVWRISARNTSKHFSSTTTSRVLAPSSQPQSHLGVQISSPTRRGYASTPMAAPTDTIAEEVQSSTGITPDTLTQTLKSSGSLNPSHVDIQDISGGCGASFAALIVSDAFQGKSALQRHRLVNGLLKDEIKAIHAWTPKCLTTEQWEKEKEKMQ